MTQETRRKIINQTLRKWCVYAFATLLLISLGSICMRPSAPALGQLLGNVWYFAPVALASLLLLPFLIFEVIAANNRITGPIQRLRGEMVKLKDGQALRTLKLRDGDHWNELAKDFNALVDQIHSERNQTADDTPPAIFSIKRSGG